ncbi:MAG TPA: EAL domain-containing protein [Candidatus Saccharimonadales bacterium]|nr:EAL domain-containing protein [Candidatus Saccharimonadales bacterium]
MDLVAWAVHRHPAAPVVPESPTRTDRLRDILASGIGASAEQRRLESAINRARWSGGAIAMFLGPFFPNLGTAYAVGLGFFLFAYGSVLGRAAERPRTAVGSDRLAKVSFGLDIAVVIGAMLVFSPDAAWTTWIVGLWLVIIGTFRFGATGSLFSSGVLSLAYLALAIFRQEAFGYELEIQRVAFHVTIFLVTGLLLTGILRELHGLRLRLTDFYEPLLNAQSDLGEVITVNDGQRPINWNDALTEVTGLNREALAALPSIYDLFPPAERWALRQRVRTRLGEGRGDTFEADIVRPDGERRRLEIALEPLRRNGRPWTVAVARDITARKIAEEDLAHQALHDPLTGLANRTLLRDRAERALVAARRDSERVALMVLDLDQFKEVNDTFGHQAGDDLLRQVGLRIAGCLRESDTVARLGGDEFAVLLFRADAHVAELSALGVLSALDAPFSVAGQQLKITASIGTSVFPDSALDVEALLREADVAMYVAKRRGSGHAAYQRTQDASAGQELVLMAELRTAIEAGQLLLHYQPLVRLDGKVLGMEALVRWQHPERGLLPPTDFIRLAERSGLVLPLFDWVLRTATQQCKIWRAGAPDLTVAVNLSMRNLQDPQLGAMVGRALEAADLPASALMLEITESLLFAEPDRGLATFKQLHGLGVRLALDDFGTGYSSLSHLHQLPVDQLKIDRSFVTNLTRDEGSAAIVRSTIDLGHNFHLEVVAEGIEDRETWEVLRALGCDTAQGYYVSRPLPFDRFSEWLAAR